jgi:REP element-mobilizing transposase RayT
MPQSLSAVYLHLVFSTKQRRPFLRDRDLREETHAYLGGISKALGCTPVRIGGVEDHVHLLARQSRTLSQAGWVKELKRSSSLWLKERDRAMCDFAWQAGYGAFSVSASNVEAVRDYIARQEEHHRKASFQDEFRAMLKKHGVTWDERYVWD